MNAENETGARILSIGEFLITMDPDSGELEFPEGVLNDKPGIRRRQDMKDVILNPTAQGPDELYYMYRGISRSEDQELIAEKGLRFDITVIMPGRIGRELIKTAGHYHPPVTEYDSISYPELYEVISGRAHYLIQKPGENGFGALCVALIPAEAGDKVLIPSNYGHITINPGEEPLVMANWVAGDFTSVYDPIKKQKGGAYFEIYDPRIGYRFLPNNNYGSLPPIVLRPIMELPELGISQGVSSYSAFLKDPSKFRYLTTPQDYLSLFQAYLGSSLSI